MGRRCEWEREAIRELKEQSVRTQNPGYNFIINQENGPGQVTCKRLVTECLKRWCA